MKLSFRKLFKSDPTPQPNLKEIGWETSNLYTSKDFPKYNPDDLIGRKGYGIYKKMMLDDQVKAVTEFKIHAVISRGYYFDVETDKETGETNIEHEKIADFFKTAIKNIRGSFSDNLAGMLSGLYNGFSISEKIYEPLEYDSKKYWGIKDIKLRPFDSFCGGFNCDQHGNLLELNQMIAAKEIKIPYNKVIHFVHQPNHDSHYGESDLRACYRSYWSKDIIIKFQNIHLERHGSGFVWAQTKDGATLDSLEQTNLRAILKNLTAATAVTMPHKVDLNMMQPNRTDAYEKAVAQHDKAIAKSILVPNLLGLSEQGQTGSYSQSQTQLNAFFWVLDHIAQRLSQALNEQLFKELALWNFATDDFPWFCFEPLTDDQKVEFAKAWTELIKDGAVTKSDTDEARIRDMLGMPEKAEGDEEEIPDDFPEELPTEIPDNNDWINAHPDQNLIKKELAEKKWLKRVNFNRIERNYIRNEDSFIDDLVNTLAKARQRIEYQITKITGDRSLGGINLTEYKDVAIPAGLLSEIRKSVRKNLEAAWSDSSDAAQKELPRKLFRRIGPGMDRGQANQYLTSKAMKITGVIEQRVLAAVQQVLENGVKYDKTLRQIMLDLEKGTDYLPIVDNAGRAINIPARLENIARTNIADAVNQARQSVFTDPDLKGFVVAYEYSAILDSRVTDVCEALHGIIRREWAERTPPNHYQCRSILIPVTTVDDWNKKEDNIPVKGNPHKGFG